MAANWYEQQIKNNNYLSPIGFKFIIEKEQEFLADYQILLKKLFDIVFNCDLTNDIKRVMLVIIAEGLYNHQIVMDKEINNKLFERF